MLRTSEVLLRLALREGWGEGTRSGGFVRCCCVEAGAGNSPRRASHFLCLAKESNQRKATPLRATLRFATGNLRCSLFAGSAQTRFAQTRAALIREKLRSSARAEGIWVGPLLRSATNGLAARGLGQVHANVYEREHEHEYEYEYVHVRLHLHLHVHVHVRVRVRECQRERGPRTHADLHATQGRAMARWSSNPLWPRRGAELFADQGRACLSEASLRGPREERAPQVARSEAQGRGQWGRLSLVTFFGETKKVTRPPGRNPGPGLKPTARFEIDRPVPPPQLSPRRGGSKTGAGA
ncbi:hypothetical protein WDL1CHR_05847 [Variovorax sp. WDL1]|nr:hypothetical protein CHC06_07872 [Variovorax sp. B2]PNG47827.1 hypothetical protein CHC07_06996 [Variovorax sp. B4]VTV15440.1 hypothetical protein WDL1CHR_05847 [Variovorax sp. WDL1]